MQLKPWVILPLYLYPAPNAWKPLFHQIDKFPAVNFQIIINPDSGPGAGTIPDSNWIEVISRLNAKKNTQLIGYVNTEYTRRNISSVQADIARYAGWAKHKQRNIKLDGIFVDETPNESDPDQLNYMNKLAVSIRKTMNVQPLAKVVFNPGTPVPAAYYSMADTVVAYESYYDTFSTLDHAYPMAQISATNRKKSAVMINQFTGGAPKQAQLLRGLAEDDIKAVYISTLTNYAKFSGLWPDMIRQIAAQR